MSRLRVIFMGTSFFALNALEELIKSRHEVVAVYTVPPKPSGRGYKVIYSPIHQLAEQHNIAVYTPANFKLDDDVMQFSMLKPDVAVVAAYGIILPSKILNIPKYGAINIHPSSLPRYRGAAPIQRTILAGDKETSVCIIKMDEGMDTGPIIMERHVEIDDSISAFGLSEVCAKIGAEMVINVLDDVANMTLTPQKVEGVSYARKIEKDEARIDFGRDVRAIHCQIRAFSPSPGAYFVYNQEIIKILEATYVRDGATNNIWFGVVVNDNLCISCNGGFLYPSLLQRQGRKMIYTAAFLRGFQIPKGSMLMSSSEV